MPIVPIHVQRRIEQRWASRFHSTGCVKRAKECWNESHTTNGSPRPAKTKAKPAG
jgi:hypothetical protein